ncbi:hypothetical protein CAL12_16950 [Bordetella genomosp. 8]|uniref:Uncharacterized protein n=1 Tax=Bordetella genomosp. 8 TaxID=1416806 RepID=A0A1W6YMN9_9BORD|nr:hypothetical protein [Bordetella genomosp. 8]ARP82337.1 hypothetical protein CAL12_16950 [Bordetella genomosp. 8]
MSEIKPLITISTAVNIDEGAFDVVSKVLHDNQGIVSAVCILATAVILYMTVKVIFRSLISILQVVAQMNNQNATEPNRRC